MAEKKAAAKKAAPAAKKPAAKGPSKSTSKSTPKSTAAKKPPAKKVAAKKAAPAESPEDAMRRRFRDALDHKHGTSGAKQRGHESGHGPALVSNDKRQQMFRRKSGG